MANYCCTTRTNYFHVKDPDAFLEFMAHVCGREDNVEVWQEKDADGDPVFGFGLYGGILGYLDNAEDEDEEYDYGVVYSRFFDGLSKHVADDDAVLIMETGNEKMRYVVGQTIVITSKTIRTIDMVDVAECEARKILGNDKWTTQVDY